MMSNVGWVRVKMVNSPLCHPRLERGCGRNLLSRVNVCRGFFPGCDDSIGIGVCDAEGRVSAHTVLTKKPLFRPSLEKSILGCIFGCINWCRGT